MVSTRLSPTLEYAGGMYPKNSMIRGRTARWGLCRFFSQLRTVCTSAPRVAATFVWYRPRSSRRFRIGSPKVTKVLGYIGVKGFFVVRTVFPNGNASLPLWPLGDPYQICDFIPVRGSNGSASISPKLYRPLWRMPEGCTLAVS